MRKSNWAGVGTGCGTNPGRIQLATEKMEASIPLSMELIVIWLARISNSPPQIVELDIKEHWLGLVFRSPCSGFSPLL